MNRAIGPHSTPPENAAESKFSQHIAIGLLAKNEAAGIHKVLDQLSRQSLLRAAEVDIHVVANGCTDDTAQVAREAISKFPIGLAHQANVHETPVGGKSRSWNYFVHALSAPSCNLIILMDADIGLADDEVLADMVATLVARPNAMACTGRPTKSIALKSRKSILDKFSLAVSNEALVRPSINGSLYVARADELRTIWLPEPTPGEDGFLNAMAKTRGFTDEESERVCRIARVSHFYDGVTACDYFKHQKRMIIGTAVNFWLFEYIRANPGQRPVGEMIREKNEQHPGWVGMIVAGKTRGKQWVVPKRVLVWHFDGLKMPSTTAAAIRLVTSTFAAALNFVACVLANRSLRREGSETYW